MRGTRAPKEWIKRYHVLLWDVTVDNGDPDAFLTSHYRFAGFSETHTYSKALWLFLNLLGLGFLVLGSMILLIVAIDVDTFELLAISSVLLLFDGAYAGIFYLVTFLPPKESEILS